MVSLAVDSSARPSSTAANEIEVVRVVIGQDLRPEDAAARVVGTVPFVLDKRVDGVAYARVARSLFPHARIRAIDRGPVLEMDGVLEVVTGEDLASDARIDPYFGAYRKDQPVLAIERVRYVGDPVAVVVAETAEAAAAGADALLIDYEELPYVETPEQAMADGAPLLHEAYPGNDCGWGKLRYGDIEAGWRESDAIIESEFSTPAGSHVPMEPFVAIADWRGDQVEVWTSTQAPHNVRYSLAKVFSLAPDRVRIRTLNIGGGFGAKGQTKIEPITVAASRATGRPVRLELTREEVFFTVGKHSSRIRIKTGVKSDGTLVARQVEVLWNAGAYAITSPVAVIQGMARAPGPYRIPHVWVDSRALYTNTVPTGPFRGAMTTQVAWAYESQMDEIAERLGIDPLEIRRANLLQDGDLHATGEAVHDVHFLELLEDAAAAIGWDKPSDPAPAGMARGKGLGIILKSTLTPSRSEARLVLNIDGGVVAYSSSVEMGQGAAPTLRQILAHELDMDPLRIRFVFPDTDVTPFDTTTSSSRTTSSMGTALRHAAHELQRQLSELAAKLNGVSADDLVHEGGKVMVAGQSDSAVTYDELLRRSRLRELAAEGVFQSEGELDPDTGQGRHTVHWHQGAAGVEVEVDLDTGKVKILHCHGVSWAGKIVSPLRVRQQNEGCVVWGASLALLEELAFDEGQMVNPNLSDYMIPSILDIPRVLTTRSLEHRDSAGEIHGVGEMVVPAVPPAVGNAVHAATGVRIRDLPISPERVLRALHGQRKTS